MKSILETSMYLIILTLISLISIDFVIMNQRITKVNEVTEYIQDYIEIHGTYEQTAGTGEYILDAATLQMINQKAASAGMTLQCQYENATEEYLYFRIKLEYSLSSAVFHLNKRHTFEGFSRVSMN